MAFSFRGQCAELRRNKDLYLSPQRLTCKNMELSRLAAALADKGDDAVLPVDKWHPERHGDIDIVIRADGSWVHEGGIIQRPELVRLFSRVLRKDEDGYVLVTPAERLHLKVEDVPFLISDLERDGERLRLRSNVGDEVTLGPDHPLEMRVPATGGDTAVPYVLIRGNLWARFDRPAYYRLVTEESCDREGRLVVESDGYRFDLGEWE